MIELARRGNDVTVNAGPARRVRHMRFGQHLHALILACSAVFIAELAAAEPSLPPLPQKVLRQVTQDEAAWNKFPGERMRIEAAASAAAATQVTPSTTWPLLLRRKWRAASLDSITRHGG